MNIAKQVRTEVRFVAVLLAAAVSSLSTPAEAATDGVNGVTISSVTLYAGTTLPGAIIFFSPAKPGMGGCANASGNAVWIDWSSTVQPDGKALYASLFASYLIGKTVGFGTTGCTSDGYPIVYGVNP